MKSAYNQLDTCHVYLDSRVRYVEWYSQIRAAAKGMSRFEYVFDTDERLKLAVL